MFHKPLENYQPKTVCRWFGLDERLVRMGLDQLWLVWTSLLIIVDCIITDWMRRSSFLCFCEFLEFFFARNWPRALQIMNNALLIWIFFIFFEKHVGFLRNQWKPIRTAFLPRPVVSCLSSARARRRLWEPPDMLIAPCFHVRAPLFLKRISERFFAAK